MKDLLTYTVSQILGNNDFEIVEEESTKGYLSLKIITDPKNIGLIIGRKGRTINAIRNLLKVKATLDKVGFSLEVSER